MSTQILGLAGFAQSGKDTSAHALIETGWTRMAFGDAIRSSTLATVKWVKIRGGRVWWLAGHRPWRTVSLAALVNEIGWEAAKKHPEVRGALQNVGKDARDQFGANAWTDAVMRAVNTSDGPVVITDVRFPAEVDAIRAAGGRVVRIVRPGTGPVNEHPSETALEGYELDAVVVNDGTPADIQAKVHALATQ